MCRLLSSLLGIVLAFAFFDCGGPGCPSNQPLGEPCSNEGQVCHYDTGCGEPQPYVCQSSTWSYEGLYDCGGFWPVETQDSGHDGPADGSVEGGPPDDAATDAPTDTKLD